MLGIRILAQKGWSIQRIHRYTGYPIPTIVAILQGQRCAPPHPALETLALPPTAMPRSSGWGRRTSFDQVAAFVSNADTVRPSWSAHTVATVEWGTLS